MVNLDTLGERLVREEGERLRVYDDATGKDLRPGMTLVGYPTIGVGINLCEGITQEESRYLLRNRTQNVAETLAVRCRPWFSGLDQVRQQVLADMAYNCGIAGLLGFTTMIRHVANGEFTEAARAGRLSKWASQVGARADVLMTMLESGVE